MTVEIRLYVEIDASDKSHDEVRTVLGDIAQGAMDVATVKRVHCRHFDAIVIETMTPIDFYSE